MSLDIPGHVLIATEAVEFTCNVMLHVLVPSYTNDEHSPSMPVLLASAAAASMAFPVALAASSWLLAFLQRCLCNTRPNRPAGPFASGTAQVATLLIATEEKARPLDRSLEHGSDTATTSGVAPDAATASGSAPDVPYTSQYAPTVRVSVKVCQLRRALHWRCGVTHALWCHMCHTCAVVCHTCHTCAPACHTCCEEHCAGADRKRCALNQQLNFVPPK
eukprot:364255-Chlamydomonas_euryale.AAC.1